MMSSLPLPPPPPIRPDKSRRGALLVCFGIAALVAGVILLYLGKGGYHNYRLASAAVERFHQQLNAAEYDTIYSEATNDFRQSSNHDDTIRFLQSVHDKMGNAGKTSTIGFHMNWNKGHLWVNRVLNTQFALGQGQENFIWILEQDQLQLYGYHITSPNLR
jgi:hypothetical protein